MSFIHLFQNIRLADLSRVGGKNASLGELYSVLSAQGISVPDGFALDVDAYRYFLRENQLEEVISGFMTKLDVQTFYNLAEIGQSIRTCMLEATLPPALVSELLDAYRTLRQSVGANKTFAVRSSATAEDLPTASFAGQQESYLNVSGEENLLQACQRCYASLFTDRAIKYRIDNGFDHRKVALSVGVQAMVRSDLACSGVMFTLDPDSGFEGIVLVSGAWGLGENVVQGAVNTDEFMVLKTLLGQVKKPVFAHKLGSKQRTMVFAPDSNGAVIHSKDAVVNLDTPPEKQKLFVLNDEEVAQLAEWACIIQQHYGRHMDIEWAKDGLDGRLYIVQARPETVHSKTKRTVYNQYALLEKGEVLCSGAGLGNKIVSGKARILHHPSEISKLAKGEILITERTDPDWDPLLKRAGAIVTNQGGRTSHAAIVAREVGTPAVVGTGNGTQVIRDEEIITVSTAAGAEGFVYRGALRWSQKAIDLSSLPKTKTKAMLILAHPDEAFLHAQLPCDGVGLLRLEFIINNTIGIHPMALRKFDDVTDSTTREAIEQRTEGYRNKADFFVDRLAEATAKIAAAFYPKEVIVRMSDFKSNEYANLLGGKQFEPSEENPMIGFRGASRYYHPLYQPAFELECAAMQRVRDEMGFQNVKLMIPFCRTVEEAQKVIAVMHFCGLERGKNGLQLYVMVEIPSNALLAEDFAHCFDGFSIGSNDLTQLTLGADRDSELLSDVFTPFDPAVMQLIELTLAKAKTTKTHTGLCGQAPSDYPEYARFLVQHGIDSISFNPDALLKGIENIAQAEKKNINSTQ